MTNSKIMPQELEVAESLDKHCVIYLHVATLKYLIEATILNREDWFWLLVSESSIHHGDGDK